MNSISARCGLLAAILGATSLFGWALDIPLLQTLLPGFVSMKPNTALCFILAGTALSLSARPEPPRWLRYAGSVCAMLVLALSITVLFQFLLHWDSGLDELLFKDSGATPRTAAPGRMAIPTAVAFLLTASALLVTDWEPRRGVRPADALALLTGLLGVASLLQHALTTADFDTDLGVTPMALNTSLAFLALGIGILVARPRLGLAGALCYNVSNLLERRIYLTVGTGTLLLVLAGTATILSAYDSVARARQVSRANQAIHQLQVVLSSIQDVETGERGFALTGETPFLEPYESALARTSAEMRTLSALFGGDPDRAEPVRRLKDLIEKKFTHSTRVVEVRRAEGAVPAASLVAQGHGKQLMDAIRGAVAEIQAEQSRQLAIRHTADEEGIKRLTAAVAAGGILVFGVLLLAILGIQRGFRLGGEAEERFRTLADNIDPLAWMTDRAGHVIWYSQRWVDYTGMTLEELRGRNWTRVHHPDHIDRVARTIQQSLEEGERWEDTFPLRAADGTYRWFLSRAVPIRDRHGAIIRWFGTNTDITERRAAEDALRESEENLAITLRSIGDAVMTTDVEGRVTALNPVAELLTGWTESDARGRPVDDVFHIINEHTRKPAEVPVRRVLETGRVQGLANHTVLIARDGAEHPIADSAAPVHDGARNIRGVVLVFRDVTVERAAEAERERYYDLSLDMLCVASADGYFKRANRAFTTALGWTVEEMLSRPFIEFVHPDDRAATAREVERQVALGETVLEFQNRYQHKDGSWRTLSWRSVPQPGGLMFGTARDVTDRVKDEEARNLLAALVESSEDAILSMGLDGTILSWNLGAEKLFGYSRAEIIGQPVTTLYPPGAPEEAFQALSDLLRGEKVEHFETTRRHRDGTLISVSVTLSPIRDGSGKITAMSKILRDISRRKRMDAELERARAAAEAANEAKSRFLATMSHEIRTPMNGVIGMVDVLRQTSLRAYQLELVEIVRESAYSLLSIIDDILDFAKIEAGKMELEHSPVSLEQLVETVCDSLNPVAVRKQVDLTCFLDPRLPPRIVSDALRLRQILNNLLGNAIKFSSVPTRPGKVHVRVEWDSVSSMRLSVTDNGVGMTPDVVAKLFSPFTQADGTTTRNFGGTGLGLSICKQLIALLGGTIDVESSPGAGSTFIVRLPVEVSGNAAAEPAAHDLKGIQCFIVNSDPRTAADWRVYLEYAGASANILRSIDDAAQRVTATVGAPAVVVIDGVTPPLEIARFRSVFSGAQADVRFVLVTRQYHRRPFQEAPDAVVLDGDAMRRDAFIYAVALAAGRAAPAPDEVWGLVSSQPSPPSRDEAAAQGRLILVAEDNDINRKVIRHQLTLLGYACEIASDGAAALACWRTGGYGLLLTDLHMPVMDGYELTRTIRSEEDGGWRLPIIAFTANITKGERERCEAAGMDDYLSKPAQLDVFSTLLDKWLTATETLSQGRAGTEAGAAPRLVLFDPTVLPRMAGPYPDIISEFLADFLRSAETQAAQLRAAADSGDWQTVGNVAHRLTSSSRWVGAIALGDTCARLEAASKHGNAAKILALADEFEQCMATSLDIIRKEAGKALG